MVQELLIPDRYEGLEESLKNKSYKTIIVQVDDALNMIDDIYEDMSAAGRGAFLILKGQSGVGKSTFLHTIHLFREGVEVVSIWDNESINDKLNSFEKTKQSLRVIVIEGREAIIDLTNVELEKSVHTINMFLRGNKGKKTIIVWPCNTDGMKDNLVRLADYIGGEALLGISEKYYEFNGPPKKDYINIAKNTLHLLNNGATFNNLGITEEYVLKLVDKADTIGAYLAELRQELRKNKEYVRKLTGKEQTKMWVVVIAGNEPDKDVAALTRGSLATADIDRLMVATKANIVEDIKQYPEKIGILSTIFDSRIIFLPILTVLAIARDYADAQLRDKMSSYGLVTKPDNKSLGRLKESELAYALENKPIGLGKQGSKTGPNSIEAFNKLSKIASTNDKLLNRTIAEVLMESNLINSYNLEKDFGNGLTRRTDIVCNTNDGKLRLEIMWRSNTGKADIANYTLKKLYNYGRAIKFLE